MQEMEKYEGMFIVKAELGEKEEEKVVNSINKSITKHKGNVTLSEKWGNRRLAYAIKSQKEGVYYRFEFDMEPKSVVTLKRDCKLNENIIRELILVKK